MMNMVVLANVVFRDGWLLVIERLPIASTSVGFTPSPSHGNTAIRQMSDLVVSDARPLGIADKYSDAGQVLVCYFMNVVVDNFVVLDNGTGVLWMMIDHISHLNSRTRDVVKSTA